ncbi:phosphatase PAP2 family protein [Methylophaga pinxianii]|uniref:phosphatase PAP2 family protein n=1 Tax=Methylophaga pinxianii TaxID=2881052 RepID=UPI001CF22A18|nr:phosphatase PAP2 family protein [Methylophaga pinxianii]MCB2425985.1 phosphatase PAP2 family protein [Methylophaga pinxianii]UPH47187.1 phosphatase PAP2 family protein [Methylophaga pinxianii]
MLKLSRSSSYRFWLLLIIYLFMMILLDYGSLDLKIAGYLYSLEGNQWLLRKHWFTTDVLHTGGRWLNYIAVICVLVITVVYSFTKQSKPDRARAWQALSLSLFVSFVTVSYLKTLTNIDCPWSLALFGGNQPYLTFFSDRSDDLPLAHCFPAGHASIGYAWVSLYFMLRVVKPQWRYFGLCLGLGLGLLFGISQQLRGAHFVSHDLTTLFICLISSHAIFKLFYGKQYAS